ncbi:hypothetical protein ACTXGQ_19785 [Marinobacter sp. 1Y8]
MPERETEVITAQLCGYLDALASINTEPRAHRASARLVDLDLEKVDRAVADYFAYCEQEYRDDFPELDIPSYRFEPAKTINDWIRVLERELEQQVLPSPILSLVPEVDQKSIRGNLAWHTMELIRMISDDFHACAISKIRYRIGEHGSGTLYMIPLDTTSLMLTFEASE